MEKHQIKHRWNNTVLFECDVPDNMASGLRTRHALENAVVARANLAYANLAGANLTDANLAGAYLAGANLAGANLAYANLAGAYLADAYLTGANLTDAYLAGANLAYANLAGANLADANLAGAKWRDGIVINKPPIQLFGLRWRVTILDAHMQIGCELHKLSDWTAYDDARIAAMDGREALRFWRAHRDVLLGLAKSAGRGIEEAQPEAAEDSHTQPSQ